MKPGMDNDGNGQRELNDDDGFGRGGQHLSYNGGVICAGVSALPMVGRGAAAVRGSRCMTTSMSQIVMVAVCPENRKSRHVFQMPNEIKTPATNVLVPGRTLLTQRCGLGFGSLVSCARARHPVRCMLSPPSHQARIEYVR